MTFYRYELVSYEGIREPKLFERKFILRKETPAGYWICQGRPSGYQSDKRWIPKVSKKRYAYPTQIEALDNYIRRTTRRRGILLHQVDKCAAGIRIAKEMYENLKSV